MAKKKSKRLSGRVTHPKPNGAVSKAVQLPPPSPHVSPKIRKLMKLMKSWLEDESGYDEETWPQLQEALKKNRTSI